LHIIDNTWFFLIIFFSKKTDMKFIILVSTLKEISPSVFSWKKKEYIKSFDVILLSKYDSAEKKILNYAYLLKNGLGRYNIFFLFLHKACRILLFVSFSCRISQYFGLCHVTFSATNNFPHYALPNEFTVYVVWIVCR
jgi:hypothetical protein